MPNQAIGTFRTLDSTFPEIVGITPTTHSVISTAPSTISIAFDEPMDPASFNALTISGMGTPSLNFTGLTAGNTVANYTVSGLEESSTYHLNFWTSGIQDANGNPLTLTWESYSFRTVDTMPPIAIAIGTPTNAVGLATNSFQIFFNEEINGASLSNSVYLDRRNHLGTLISSEMLNYISLDNSRKIATFTRSLPGTLLQNAYYEIRLEPGIADTSNNVTIGTRSFKFKTVDTVNPTIANYTLDGPVPTQFVDGIHFTIQFTEEMDRNTLTNAVNAQIRVTNVNLPVQLQSYDPITFVASYWIPSFAFLDGQNYATIYGRTLDIFRNNAAPPRDLSGRAVGAFSYPVSLTNDPPAVQPLIGYLRRADITDTTAVLTMNRSMDATTLSTVSFSLGYRYRTYYPYDCRPNKYSGTRFEPIFRNPLEWAGCIFQCDVSNGMGFACDRSSCNLPVGHYPVSFDIAGCAYGVNTGLKNSMAKVFTYSGNYSGFNFIDSNSSTATFSTSTSNSTLEAQIYEDRSYCGTYSNWQTYCPRASSIDNLLYYFGSSSYLARDFLNNPLSIGGIQ
ncbi:Ig-like domain-containing protein [Leptospira sp. GIMC2001]|uniref:Ig-like domain-containing protein n=1 Tax=Leptospira sp. GIMC2001 TaxID=1513297 RepID=UPI00234A298B|nr:Ig-like domain-containing protein [Leptospira sp. GIMC2001]WCL48487.1 Ig-like domain-containing protein [Leptospira sp. GIMC2001]